MTDLECNWRAATEEAIKDINLMISSKEEYDADFVKLATFVMNTKVNPYSFMPAGWEGSFKSAQSTADFLHMLHHAMVDDGELCFIETDIHGSFMCFIDRYETEYIKKIVEKKFSYSLFTRTIEYEVHVDVNRFLKGIK